MLNDTSPMLRIGTSGYQYGHWRGVFYPKALRQRQWFDFYAQHFDTVEINNTFYQLPSEPTVDHWREQAPPGFCYALKFSRYGTHLKRLKDPAPVVERFAVRVEPLGALLGPILVQLPPRFTVNAQRLAAFLDCLPKTSRWVLEFRDPTWLCERIYALLRAHNAALCIHDLIDDHPREVTADFTYLRFHGDHYRGRYSHQFLTAQAVRIVKHLAAGLRVFAYFNNDVDGYAVQNAAELKRYVAQRW